MTRAQTRATSTTPRKRRPTKADLEVELAALHQQLAELQQDNSRLEAALASATEQATAITEALQQEKEDLETILQMTTQHSDTMEEELHERVEEALRKSEQQLRMIVEATPAPVSISRISDDEMVYANAGMGPLLGGSTAELLGRQSVDFYHDSADRHVLMEKLQAQRAVDRYELRMKRLDGAALWVEVSMRPLEFNDEPAVLAAFHDITHLKEMNHASSRFVPQEYLGFLEKESIIHINLGDYVTGEMTVMFSDLRDFTAVSEQMTPQENFAFINSYLGRVSPVVGQHNGFIIKYLGDGIHAIFPRRADDGIQAGIEKLERVNAYNDYRLSKNRRPIAVGIGINTGYIMVGMVGDQHRMQGDTFADDVNLTARLEALTKFYGISFIISQATYDRLADPGRYDIRYLDKVQVKGSTNALKLYEVYDADPPPNASLEAGDANRV